VVDRLFQQMYATEGYELSIDLEQQVVQTPSGESIHFDVDAFRKHCLLNGLDDIALTLESAAGDSQFRAELAAASRRGCLTLSGSARIRDIWRVVEEFRP
jgi:3-isopropylmalate dehydratase small subunit